MAKELERVDRPVGPQDIDVVIMSSFTSQCDAEVRDLESSSDKPTREWIKRVAINNLNRLEAKKSTAGEVTTMRLLKRPCSARERYTAQQRADSSRSSNASPTRTGNAKTVVAVVVQCAAAAAAAAAATTTAMASAGEGNAIKQDWQPGQGQCN